MDDKFLEKVGNILVRAKHNIKTAVNLSMVYTYYEIGKMIVEEEQNGAQRAEYGQYILKNLSAYLTENFGKGYSTDNLKLMRKFYTVYSHDTIGETVFPQSEKLPSTETGRKFYLSWSHYLKLMRIDNVDERHFYEIEASRNDWSLSELKRQFNTSLYERLALSTDSRKGVIRTPILGGGFPLSLRPILGNPLGLPPLLPCATKNPLSQNSTT